MGERKRAGTQKCTERALCRAAVGRKSPARGYRGQREHCQSAVGGEHCSGLQLAERAPCRGAAGQGRESTAQDYSGPREHHAQRVAERTLRVTEDTEESRHWGRPENTV